MLSNIWRASQNQIIFCTNNEIWKMILLKMVYFWFTISLWFWVFQGRIQLRNQRWNRICWIFFLFSSTQVHCQRIHLVCSKSWWILRQLPKEPCHPILHWIKIVCIVRNWMSILSRPSEQQGNLNKIHKQKC